MPFRIGHLWCFIAIDPNDGEEGLIWSVDAEGVKVPFIAADENRLRSLLEELPNVPMPSGMEVKLVRFDHRTDVQTIRRGN